MHADDKVDTVATAASFRLARHVIAVAMVLYHVWAIAFGSPEAIHFPRHASAVRA